MASPISKNRSILATSKIYISALIPFLLCSCGSNHSPEDCEEMTIVYRHFNPMGQKGPEDTSMFYSSAHHLMVKGFDEDCMSHYDFVSMADRYLDTVSTNLPVKSILFSTPFDFRPTGELHDIGLFIENGIVEFWYDIDRESQIGKLPEIRTVRFLYDGEDFTLRDLNVKNRQVGIDYLFEKQKAAIK